MKENTRGQKNEDRSEDQKNQQQEQQGNLDNVMPSRDHSSGDGLNEKSSTISSTSRGGTRGPSSKDGMTGSDLDGQVTS
ncbi:MAG: hypothetical protein ACXWB9_11080 [Flavisolibacter sp.]